MTRFVRLTGEYSKNKETGRWKRNIFRNLSAAVLTLAVAVTAFAAGLIRIVLKTQNWWILHLEVH